jgi:nucleoside-diphosphate-sugar epimerase
VLGNFGHTRSSYNVRYTSEQLGDIRLSLGDISTARRLLQWEPQVPFDQGMRETIDWAKTQLQERIP